MGIAGCFVIGSGPSLKKIEVSHLSRLHTIAFNRSYIAWNNWGFAPTYYACLDAATLSLNTGEILNLPKQFPATKFFLPAIPATLRLGQTGGVFLCKTAPGNTFSTVISTLTDFGNVGATSLQILALLGYRRIAMVGVDARYFLPADTQIPDALRHDNPNYFDCRYSHGRGKPGDINMNKVLGQWPAVAAECSARGIDVRLASPGSALQCFPQIDFATSIEWIGSPS